MKRWQCYVPSGAVEKGGAVRATGVGVVAAVALGVAYQHVVDLVPLVAKERPVKAVLNNSFGFGGTNASLVMKAV